MTVTTRTEFQINVSQGGTRPNGEFYWPYVASGPFGMRAAVVYAGDLEDAACKIINDLCSMADPFGEDSEDDEELTTPRSTEMICDIEPPDGRNDRNRIAALERRLGEVDAVLAALNESNANLLTNQDLHGTAIAELTTDLTETKRAYQASLEGKLGEAHRLDEYQDWIAATGRDMASLRADLAALTETVKDSEKWLDELTDRVAKLDTPPSACPECGNDGWNDPCYCGTDTPPQPTDAEGKDCLTIKGKLDDLIADIFGVEPKDEASDRIWEFFTKLGLATKPVDPTDERLVQVTARAMQDDNQGDCACVVWPCDHAWDYMARIALMSIAAAQQEVES